MAWFKYRFSSLLFAPMCVLAISMFMNGPVKAHPLNSDSARSTNYFAPYTQALYQPDTSIRIDEQQMRAGLLFDVVNKKIVWQKNMNVAFPIASLTKMMVALLTVEDVRAGKFAWENNVHWVRETIIGRRKSKRSIFSNVDYSLRDVFKAAMIASNNECAEQMAMYIGGRNLRASIERMNTRAHELGMTNTFYGNPTGLPASRSANDNYSSPEDQLLLALELLKYDEVIEIAAMGYAQIENGRSTSIIRNHNKLTIEYSGEVDGLKTGYTRRAGFCLVATTSKCNHRLIGIVLGCRGPEIRNQLMCDLFNDCYTAVGLDRLGPVGYSTAINSELTGNPGSSAQYVTIREKEFTVHVVRSGETLSGIAQKYHCQVSQLRAWNKKSNKSNFLVKGQKLNIYQTVAKKVLISKPANGNEEEDDKPILSDTEKNRIKTEEVQGTLKVVQQLIAVADSVKTAAEEKFIYYTVAPGDTLTSIAHQYQGTTVEQLKTLNRLGDANDLKPGMKIKVPVRS